MGNEYPTMPLVIPVDTESYESYFRVMQEAVDRLLEGRILPENTPDRGVLYGIRERHPENAINYADKIGDIISREPELLREAFERNREDAVLGIQEYTRQLRELQTTALEVAQKTLHYRGRFLQLVKPDGLYVEGVQSGSGLERIPPRIYLDEDSEAYYELAQGKGGNDQDLQKRREKEDWVTKISGSIWQFRKPLIIAGGAHLENEFGLVDLLSNNGIELHVLNPRPE